VTRCPSRSCGGPIPAAEGGGAVEHGRPEDPLEALVESLREDQKSFYLELTSQWPRIPPNVGTVSVPSQVRKLHQMPSEYIEEAEAYLRNLLRGMDAQGTQA